MIMRDYQIEIVNSILNEFKENDTALVVAETGLGKTICFVRLLEIIREHRPNFRACVMVRQVNLIHQTMEKFTDKSLVSAICGSLNEYGTESPFTVASFQTLRHKTHLKYDLMIIDEAHQMTKPMEETAKVMAPKVCGFTATPYTTKGFIYGEDKPWNNPCYQTTKEIADKYLCPITLTGTSNKANLKSLAHAGGDFVLSEAAERYTDSLLVKQLSEIRERTMERNCVALVVCNIEHAERVKALLPNSTITHSKLSKKEQLTNIELWKEGLIKYMIAVNQINTGFDHPPLDAIAVLRPTRSYALYKQIAGRGRRKHPSKKDCLFLDYGGIVNSMGLLDDVESNIVEKKPSCKLCPMCSAFLPTSQEVCGCGFNFYMPESLQRKAGDYEKNLTTVAYMEGTPVTNITSVYHISKAGNKTLKIMYWNGLSMTHAVYFLPYQKEKINKWVECNIYPRTNCTSLDNLRQQVLDAEMKVKAIVLIKKGRFKEIQNHIW